MTDIKVIIDQTEFIDFGSLSYEEREQFFEQLSMDNPSIPRHIIDSFFDMQEELLRENAKLEKPNLKELLLRKIIHFAQNRGSEFNTIVIPIIPGFVQGITKRNQSNTQNATTEPIQGGSVIRGFQSIRKRDNVKTYENIPGAIKVRFDERVLTVNTQGLDYIIPSNEEVNVVGIIFNPLCEQPKIINRNGKLIPLSAVKVILPTIEPNIILGNYTYSQAAAACDDFFMKPRLNPGRELLNSSVRILFSELNSQQIINVLSSIFDYLSALDSYYKRLDAAIYVYEQLTTALKGNPGTTLNDTITKISTSATIPILMTPLHEQKKPEILKQLETIHKGEFNTTFHGALLADLDTRGFFQTYYKSILKGIDDSVVRQHIKKYKERQARLEISNEIKQKLLDERNKISTYKVIIEKKFGVKRLAEIKAQIAKKPSINASAVKILDLLKPTERKPVQLEFEKREKYLDAVINNKCPHVKLYKKFRHTNNDVDARKLYNDLTKFFKTPTANEMIICNNCGFDIICPHLREFTELDLAGKFYAEIKGKLTKYIDRASVKDQYYCKICGEMISSLDAFGDIDITRDPASMMNEELKNFMWGEMAILTKYLKFGALVHIPHMITAMRDACYPYIFEIEKQILKSKTNSADEIKAKKRLFITIYAFAYMIHLVLSQRGRAGENEITFKNFKERNEKNVIVDMIRHALKIIILSRNIVIREIPGMTTDLIKNKLIEAYKSMQRGGSQIIIRSDDTEDLLTTLVLDPVYKYLYGINLIDDILNGKNPPRGKFGPVDRVNEIMGENITGLEKSKDIFAKMKVPKFDNKWNVAAFDNIPSLVDGKTSAGSKKIWNTAYTGYLARSFDIFADKIKQRLWVEPLYVDVGVSTKDDPNTPMNVKFREPFERHHTKYSEIVENEKRFYQHKLMDSAKSYGRVKIKNTRRYTYTNVPLGRIFDEDGDMHKWDIFISDNVVDGKMSRIEFKSGEIAKFAETGKPKQIITDRKCSICGILRSKCEELSEKKINESLNARAIVSNFFRFYENRCPKGALHDFGNGEKCTKCGIINSYIFNPTTKNSLAYFREFNTIYIREKDEFSTAESSSLLPKEKVIPTESKYNEEYAKWTFNFNVVLDLANKIKINHRLISALGAVERQEYADVQSGSYIPTEVEYRTDSRIYTVNTHVKNLITEYNQVRFFHKLFKPSMDLSSLIDNSGINRHKISELSKKLPAVFDDYNARFLYFQWNKKPREVITFVLQSFCEICLKIWNNGEKETEKLRRDFVEYFIKKILRAEELLSKPGHFNWAALYGDKDTREKEKYDMNFNRELESEKGDEIDETERDEDFGDTSAPFSTDNFDIEDNEDDEDNNNNWRVGEDLGLT